MAVTARFYIRSVEMFANNGYADPKPVGTVKMNAAVRGPENKEWASATPTGSIEMLVRNSAAFEWFWDHLGKDLAITFEEAPPVE